MIKQVLMFSVVIFVLLGCVGPLVTIEKVDTNIIPNVTLYEDDTILKNPDIMAVGVVNATSCKNLLWDPPATIENCHDQLRMKAYGLRAHGVIIGDSKTRTVDYAPGAANAGINRNCWETVDCSGIAVIDKSKVREK
jgi:hypothetical protein